MYEIVINMCFLFEPDFVDTVELCDYIAEFCTSRNGVSFAMKANVEEEIFTEPKKRVNLDLINEMKGDSGGV